MLSRVANAIYWMNRYMERAENYARFMDVNFNLSLELQPDESEQWQPLVATTGDWDLYGSLYEKVDKENVIHFLGFDDRNPNSIYSCIIKARENTRVVRPEITKEVWEQINALYYFVKKGKEEKQWEKIDPRSYFNEIKKGCQLLHGIVNSTISKTEGWHFGRIGQLIERADKTSRILDVKYHMLLPSVNSVGSPADLIQWASLLKSVSAYDMYLRKNGKLTSHGISEFLIFDKNFPRSIFSCLSGVELSLHTISGEPDGYSNQAERRLGKLKSELDYADIQEIFNTGLHQYLDDLQIKLNEVSGSIYDTFFSIERNMDQQMVEQ